MKVTSIFLFLFSFAIFTQEKPSTNALLINPFDLQKFKKAKGPSNSGGADVQAYYIKPKENGVYFRFFLFNQTQAFVYEANENKRKSIRPGTGFQIITYKPLGKYRDDYFDPTETLIEVTASYNDPDLPELALVGLDTLIIKNKLGTDFIRKDGCFIYAKENNVLLLKIAEGLVTCLKYTRLNRKLTPAAIPEKLLVMDCVNVPVH